MFVKGLWHACNYCVAHVPVRNKNVMDIPAGMAEQDGSIQPLRLCMHVACRHGDSVASNCAICSAWIGDMCSWHMHARTVQRVRLEALVDREGRLQHVVFEQMQVCCLLALPVAGLWAWVP